MSVSMTDEQRNAVIEISKCLCLSCKHNPKVDEYYLIRQAQGMVEPMLYCKSLSARTIYDKYTGKCHCTAYEKEGVEDKD